MIVWCCLIEPNFFSIAIGINDREQSLHRFGLDARYVATNRHDILHESHQGQSAND